MIKIILLFHFEKLFVAVDEELFVLSVDTEVDETKLLVTFDAPAVSAGDKPCIITRRIISAKATSPKIAAKSGIFTPFFIFFHFSFPL